MHVADGVVVRGAFLDGKAVKVWEAPEGEG
jgi:hypothetical protein